MIDGRLGHSATTHAPVEVYLRSSYEPDAEYVEERSRNDRWGRTTILPGRRQFASGSGNMRGLERARQAGIGVPVAPHVRVPNVTVLPRDRPVESIVTLPPLAVFEVLSPEDNLQRLKRKLEDYRIMGIPEIWVIDPQDSTYYRYEQRQLLRNDSFSHAGHGIEFEMNRIKDQLD